MVLRQEYLDSDRVNFLIWRYLLESNYRETAAKLQKEWNVKRPHLDFEFAPNVHGHALVSIIQRGLLFQAYERQHASTIQPSRDAAAEAEPQGIFGPLITEPPTRPERHEKPTDDGLKAPNSNDLELPRKRNNSQLLVNGSPTKRQRLSNAGETRSDGNLAITPMEIDGEPQQQISQPDDSNAYPSPLVEGEQPPTPIVHTEGPEQGTQVDKVDELLPDTTFISLTDEARPGNGISSPIETTATAPILLHTEWNPKEPSILAAAGTDALARIWSVGRTPVDPDHTHDHVTTNVLSLIGPDASSTTTTTAMAWNSDGSVIAVATDTESQAAINICSLAGIILNTLEVSESPIIKLCWNPSDTALLAISPHSDGALVAVYDAATTASVTYVISGHDITANPLDAAWTSDTEFLLSGGNMLVSLFCDDTSIVEVQELSRNPDNSFTQVLYDRRSKLAATSSEKGTLDLWDGSGRRTISAHQGAITTMAWQPLPPNHPNSDEERLIATGGEDCAILIWNARTPESKAKCFLNMNSPIVRLAFTPDGAFIAGATANQVLIWRVGSPSMPRATWSRPPLPGWISPKAGSETDEEDEHCLCWDASGKRLAYGSNSRLAVINFNR